MRTVKHIALIALASAALACAADVTRQTEWQDVPPGTTIGTVVDLGQGGGLTTNDVSTVITNHVTSGYLATVDEAQAMTNAVMAEVGGMRKKSDMSVYVWGNFRYGRSSFGTYDGASEISYRGSNYWDGFCELDVGSTIIEDIPVVARATEYATNLVFRDENYDRIAFSTELIAVTSDAIATSNMVNGIVAPIADTVAEQGDAIEGKADAASVSQLATSVSAIAAHLNAEDARFVTTNYDNSARLPESYLEIKVSNEWLRVWSEMARWNRFAGTNFNWNAWSGFDGWKSNVEAEIDDRAYKCWGMYDSETGDVSPDGFTQISSSNIVIASGMGYQRTLTTGGAVWVLQCNSGTATLGGDTNGYFRVMDGLGETQFEIIQGNRRELPGDAGGVEVLGPQSVRITYSIECDTPPTLWICDDLTTRDWKASTNDSCIATATWAGASGEYVATVTAKSPSTTKMFVTATYWSGGETVINNVAPVKMEYIYIGNKKYRIDTATISGHTVMTLEEQQ